MFCTGDFFDIFNKTLRKIKASGLYDDMKNMTICINGTVDDTNSVEAILPVDSKITIKKFNDNTHFEGNTLNELSRYCYDIFNDISQPTIGIDFGLKKIKDIKLQIWDTGGLERFNSIRNLYYRGINGYVVVYDIMEPNSIININRWLEQIVKYSTLDDYVVMIVGNKTDMVNSIEEEYVDKKYDYLIKNWIDMPHIIGHTICSAMNNYNINTIFDTLFKNFNPRSVYINKTVKIEINKNQSKCC